MKRSYADAPKVPPIAQWDCCRGFVPVNEQGQPAIAGIIPADSFGTPGLNLVEALAMATKLPAGFSPLTQVVTQHGVRQEVESKVDLQICNVQPASILLQ